MQSASKNRKLLWIIITVLCIFFIFVMMFKKNDNEQIIQSNGRIEITSVDISTKFAGRINEILVDEGDYVEKGDKLAVMQLDSLIAQLNEAEANYQQALHSSDSAKAIILARESDKVAAEEGVKAKESQIYAAERKLARLKTLVGQRASTEQDYEDQEAYVETLKAELATSKAQVSASQAQIDAAKAQFVATQSQVKAAQATIDRVKADITDSVLNAPVEGRIQYRIAEPGEVIAAGGKILNLLDLSKVNMTFFLPTQYTGLLSEGETTGSEVRIILDVAPDYVIPARVTFVSPEAQFTPKTVETSDERQKLMYRVKAKIDPEILKRYRKFLKTGVTGEAYIKIDPKAEWPSRFEIKPYEKLDEKVNAQ